LLFHETISFDIAIVAGGMDTPLVKGDMDIPL
jgi:hypothetical protein